MQGEGGAREEEERKVKQFGAREEISSPSADWGWPFYLPISPFLLLHFLKAANSHSHHLKVPANHVRTKQLCPFCPQGKVYHFIYEHTSALMWLKRQKNTNKTKHFLVFRLHTVCTGHTWRSIINKIFNKLQIFFVILTIILLNDN